MERGRIRQTRQTELDSKTQIIGRRQTDEQATTGGWRDRQTEAETETEGDILTE